MFVFFSYLFGALGLAVVYFFACGAMSDLFATGGESFWSLAAAPWDGIELPVILGLVLAGTFFVFSRLFQMRAERPDGKNLWHELIEWGFAVNTVIGTLVLVALIVAGGESAPALSLLGSLFVLAVLQVLLGTVLAVTLAVVRRFRPLYFCTLSFHAVETVCLVMIFVLGFRS